MAEIIPLSLYREQVAIKDGFRTWRTLFAEPFDAQTRLSDLRHKTLVYLAEPGEASTSALHSLIIGLSGYGASTAFDALDSNLQSHVLDVFLFLSDHIRFEMMLRLGWLESFGGNQYPLYRVVTAFQEVRERCNAYLPVLARDHDEYDTYAGLIERDQQVFIRRMFPSALVAFKHNDHLT